MAKLDKVAARIVDRIMAESGFIGKSAGSAAAKRAELMPYALSVAAAIADVEDQVNRAMKSYARMADDLGAKLDRYGERVRELADRHGVAAPGPRGVPDIQRGLVDLDLQRFRAGLVVENHPAPKMNGHTRDDREAHYQPPPGWHPESS